MDNDKARKILTNTSAYEIIDEYPYIENYFDAVRIEILDNQSSILDIISNYPDDYFSDYGIDKGAFVRTIIDFISEEEQRSGFDVPEVESLTILGGTDKHGMAENKSVEIKRGEIACIVGPTGSGKSRLLEDIECLAQGDTPTGRYVLLNSQYPTRMQKEQLEHRMVAQLSQNMNFVIDLSVRSFLALHAKSRKIDSPDSVIDEIILCANDLAGEKFNENTPVTQLSGGQSRALMIADTALLSSSPIILIDEIENAGIDRKKAMEVLVKKEKIILMSTHDPILALLGSKRIVIENGGMKDVLFTSDSERGNLEFLNTVDNFLLELRNHIRSGSRIENNLKEILKERINL